MRRATLAADIGDLTLVADGDVLVAIRFHDDRSAEHLPEVAAAADPVLGPASAQLAEYLAGSRTSFELPLEPRGTPFQTSVWWALADIPYGATATYGQIATRVGRPTAVRAVGAANGANPLPIVLPCHRVIGADRSLTGYGGGLDRKRWLLDLEAGRRTLV